MVDLIDSADIVVSLANTHVKQRTNAQITMMDESMPPKCPFEPRSSSADIAALSAKTDLSTRQIESWLRRRQRFADFASKPQLIDKFKESR